MPATWAERGVLPPKLPRGVAPGDELRPSGALPAAGEARPLEPAGTPGPAEGSTGTGE